MVQSLLNKNVNYVETREIDPEDVDTNAPIYLIDLLNNRYSIALGKAKFTFSNNYDIIYFPMYLIRGSNTILGKIGVYEINKNRFTSLLDDENDPMLYKFGGPILFTSTTPQYLKKTHSIKDNENIKKNKQEQDDVETEDNEEEEENYPLIENEDGDNESGDESDSDDSIFALPEQKKHGKEKEKETSSVDDQITLENVFVIDHDFHREEEPVRSLSEYKEESKKSRELYKKTQNAADTWLMQFMKSKEYKIIPNHGRGDCLFLAIVDAYHDIGYETTVHKLRQLLAQEATVSQLDELRAIYDGIMHGSDAMERKMESIRKTNSALKKQTGDVHNKDKDHMKEIIAGAKQLNREYTQMKNKQKVDLELLDEFKYMKHVKTLDDLKKYIRTSEYWADTWAISTLEKVLDMKLIILETSSSPDGVLRCGQLNYVMTVFKPKQYIMVNFSGNNHYELVSYKNRKIFTFAGVPFDIKLLVVNKCMERASGPFSIIPEFKQFQHDMGVDSTESSIITSSRGSDNENENEDTTNLFDKDVEFRFYEKSDTKKPGQVSGEKLPKKRTSEFADLFEGDANWRQMLDDTWAAAFTLHEKRWLSVMHYLLAYQFKDDTSIYNDFSLDSGSALSKSVKLAEASIVKKGKYADKVVDLTENVGAARKEALFAKFSQNADLTTILKNTHKANLLQFKRGTPPKSDILLMLVRKKLVGSDEGEENDD